MKEALKKITVLVFLSLIFFKASAFHLYEHDENPSKDCKLCLFALYDQLQGFIPTSEDFDYTNATDSLCAIDTHQLATLLLGKNFISFRLYSRPPPSISNS